MPSLEISMSSLMSSEISSRICLASTRDYFLTPEKGSTEVSMPYCWKVRWYIVTLAISWNRSYVS